MSPAPAPQPEAGPSGAAPALSAAVHINEVDVEELPEVKKSFSLAATPPWFISMVMHVIALVLLALYVFPSVITSMHFVELTYDEELGEQLLDDTQFVATSQLADPMASSVLTPNQVQNPAASVPKMEIELETFEPTPEEAATSVSKALSGRDAGARQGLLAAYGGSAKTEDAVALALSWLKRQQRRDGTWSLKGPYKNGGTEENRTAATAMALLAFQGNGHTHQTGEHAAVVARGIRALLKMQDSNGNFFEGGNPNHRLYSQAQATIVVCELFGMTKDPELREPAQRAITYAVDTQADDGKGGGGWRYIPGEGVDTSVTGWFVIALQSGRMAGLDVPQATLDRISLFLDHVTENGSDYAYRPRNLSDIRISMTAEALLCRQYLGWERNDPRLSMGVDRVLENPISWQKKNVYYWYYATQVTHHMGGEPWEKWNRVMKREVPAAQVKSGREQGSWDPDYDPNAGPGGRLYFTCFCVYMLEVYYRHLPIYQHQP